MSNPAPIVVDADGHVCEPPDLWEKNLPPPMREQGLRVRWNDDIETQQVLVEDDVGTDRGLVGLSNAGHAQRRLRTGMRYEDDNPAGFDAKERVKVLDEEGIDVAVLYCGLGQSPRRHPGPASSRWRRAQVWNDWIADWTSAAPDRLVGSAVISRCTIPPPRPPRSIAPPALGLRGGVCRPNPMLGRPLWSHDFDPDVRRARRGGHPARVARRGPYDMEGTSKRTMDG